MNVDLVASFVTLSGAGFAEPARHSFEERCLAAADAGFAGIGMHVDDFDQVMPAEMSVTDMRTILRTTGLELLEIEFLSGWTLGSDAVAAKTERSAYALADLFGGHHLSTGEISEAVDGFDLDQAAKQLGQICARAADHGLVVAVEAFPWSPIRDIRTALDLLDLADAPNAGLMVDAWHFFNCGATLDDLNGLPANRVAAVQLNDGPRVHEDFRVNARTTRWLPGDGELDVVGLVRRLAEIGFTGPYCVEVNYPEFRELPVRDAAELAHGKAEAVVQQGLAR